MAKADVKIVSPGASTTPTIVWQTEAGATDILAGEPVKLKAAGSPYVIPAADGDFTIGTDTIFVGIAQSDSTHTATADGTISVYIPLPGLVYEAKATTAANIDTQAELNALLGDRVSFDLANSTYTVDENAGDAAANGLLLVGGDPVRGTVEFVYVGGTFLNALADA